MEITEISFVRGFIRMLQRLVGSRDLALSATEETFLTD